MPVFSLPHPTCASFLVLFPSQCLPPTDSTPITALCAGGGPTQESSSLLCILAVDWVHKVGEASRTSESRKKRRSGCLVPHITPILPQTWHLLCPHISHSDLLALLLGHPPSSLQAPATLFLDLPLTLRIVPADPSLGCLQLHALHVSSLLPEPYRFSTALVFLLSGEDIAMAITPN